MLDAQAHEWSLGSKRKTPISGIAMPDGSRKLSSQSSNGGNSVTHSQHLNNSNGHSCQGGVNGVNNSRSGH